MANELIADRLGAEVMHLTQRAVMAAMPELFSAERRIAFHQGC